MLVQPTGHVSVGQPCRRFTPSLACDHRRVARRLGGLGPTDSPKRLHLVGMSLSGVQADSSVALKVTRAAIALTRRY
jgi:hypothetical protein